jgi:hypothetical protein
VEEARKEFSAEGDALGLEMQKRLPKPGMSRMRQLHWRHWIGLW